MTSLVLNNNEIAVQPHRKKYNAIRLKFQTLAEKAAILFSEAYSSNFSNIDEVHGKCPQVALGLLMPVAEEAIRDLVAQKIYDIDINEFQEYFSPFSSWDEDFAEIDDKYMAIISNAEELDAYRTQRRQNRDRVIGGGIGLEGYAKGRLMAGGINMVEGVLHGVGNLVAKGISAAGDIAKKNAIFSDPATKATLTNAIYRLVFNTHYALIAALTDKKENYVSGIVPDEDAAKAKRLLENIAKGRVPDESVKPVLFEAQALNPYDKDFYNYWYKTYGDTTGELDAIETFFGVYVSRKIKNHLVQARRAQLDLTTPEACEKNVVVLEAYAVSIGYLEFPHEKSEIIALAKKLDRERRTVEGREYTTLAAADAEREKIRLETLRKDNTVASSGTDMLKIAGGILCLLFAIAMLADPSKKSFIWIAIPLALSVLALRGVRSLRAVKFTRGIGYLLAGLGAFVTIVEICSVNFSNGTFGASDFFAIAGLIGIGLSILYLMQVRYQEAGYAKPKNYFVHALIVGGVVGGMLFGGGTIYQKSKGLETAVASPVALPIQPPTVVPAPPPTEAVSTSQNPDPKIINAVETKEAPALPFIGHRTFNFDGGNGTEMSMDIAADGSAKVELHGTTSSAVEYVGKYQNPIPVGDGDSIMVEKDTVSLYKNGAIKMDCMGDGKPCTTKLYE